MVSEDGSFEIELSCRTRRATALPGPMQEDGFRAASSLGPLGCCQFVQLMGESLPLEADPGASDVRPLHLCLPLSSAVGTVLDRVDRAGAGPGATDNLVQPLGEPGEPG